MKDWEVGDRLICLKPWDPHPPLILPEEGGIYTIRWIGLGINVLTKTEEIGVKFQEIQNQGVEGENESCFAVRSNKDGSWIFEKVRPVEFFTGAFETAPAPKKKAVLST